MYDYFVNLFFKCCLHKDIYHIELEEELALAKKIVVILLNTGLGQMHLYWTEK